MGGASACVVEEDAGSVWLVLEDESASVGRERGEARREVEHVQPEAPGEGGFLAGKQVDAAGDAAAGAALAAVEVLGARRAHGGLQTTAGAGGSAARG